MDKRFEQIYEIMEEAFPPSERRPKERQRALLEDPRYRLLTEEAETGFLLGFLAAWEFPDFLFIEHLAVARAARGRGTGGILVRRCLTVAGGKPVYLEVEPPQNEIQRRRVNFYLRLGFALNTFPYEQPPMRPGAAPLPLYVMSHPAPVSQGEFAPVRQKLYHVVYGVEENA
jgi:ribosomal protein S18 acetylase RimI-like enzyme